MSSIVMAAGVGIGIGFAFLLAQLRPVFIDRRQLNEVLGVPVIGSINLISSGGVRARQRVGSAFFVVGVLSLLSAYAVVMAVFLLSLDLNALNPL